MSYYWQASLGFYGGNKTEKEGNLQDENMGCEWKSLLASPVFVFLPRDA